MTKPLVIVESPAKARTLKGLLGSEYNVEACVGHVRDLPGNASEIPATHKKKKWARIAVDVENDFKPLYVLTSRGREQVKKLKSYLKDASMLYLATDEDREGEAIAWHLMEVLKPSVPVQRLVFHEITARAIKESLSKTRDLNMDLVHAQETRRIVDRLYGYNVSPVLWKKVSPGLSAGRVQSVAVRLVVEKERARMAFRGSQWWTLSASFEAKDTSYDGNLVEVDGTRVVTAKDFDANTGALKKSISTPVQRYDGEQIEDLRASLQGAPSKVAKLQSRPFRERPPAPFTTSTLQQEANRKFRWPASRTMKSAQRLYENGWITYMRTDSTHLSPEAIASARTVIKNKYGVAPLPSEPRNYKTKAKGAQEAHEAIRPAGDVFRTAAECAKEMPDDARLYELIWKRTIASQMRDAEGIRVVLDTMITADSGTTALFRSVGKTYPTPGFRLVYVESSDESGDAESGERILPAVSEQESVTNKKVVGLRRETHPPARLTEASLVRDLEARGIGRPSTYASIIETIQNRKYVFRKGTTMIPTWTAFAVTQLLEKHFQKLVDYEFTARLEDGLDSIALGEKDRVKYLSAFYIGPEAAKSKTLGLTDLIDEAQKTVDSRAVCSIVIGESDGHPVVARVGRYGPYIEHNGSTGSIPPELPPDELKPDTALSIIKAKETEPAVLGQDPESGEDITLRKGRFGAFVQLGDNGKSSKRATLLKNMEPSQLTLEEALQLLSLPRELGEDKTGKMVIAMNGRYGPFIKAGDESRSIPETVSVLTITIEEAQVLLDSPVSKKRANQVLSVLGKDSENREIQIKNGRFGTYLTDGETNVTLAKQADPSSIDLETALGMIAEKRAKPSSKRKRKGRKS